MIQVSLELRYQILLHTNFKRINQEIQESTNHYFMTKIFPETNPNTQFSKLLGPKIIYGGSNTTCKKFRI